MSINVQGIPQKYFLLTGNLSRLSRVRRKQQIKEHPEEDYETVKSVNDIGYSEIE